MRCNVQDEKEKNNNPSVPEVHDLCARTCVCVFLALERVRNRVERAALLSGEGASDAQKGYPKSGGGSSAP